MKVVSIGDLVTDYYYKNGKLLGVMGGMTSHNIVANIAPYNLETAVFGVCGKDMAGDVSIQSLNDLGVDTTNVVQIDNIHTRCFHVSYVETDKGLEFTSKKRCPVCGIKRWYQDSMIDVTYILGRILKDDILVFDNLNIKNQQLILQTDNRKMLDLGQYFELEEYSDQQIIDILNSKFEIINLNERVEKYLIKRFHISGLIEIYKMLKPKLMIVTRGKCGADFVLDGQIINKKLETVSKEVDSTGAGDGFFSIFISEYIKNKCVIDREYINQSFIKATKLTSKIVKEMGARGHLHSLYKIKKVHDSCLCEQFDIRKRKRIQRCSINVNNLESRVMNALRSSDYKKLITIPFETMNYCLFLGSGGSYAGANFASRVINELYGVNTASDLPRNVLYKRMDKVDQVFLFSYSGTTKDMITSTKHIPNDKKIIITKGEKQRVVERTGVSKNHIVTYRTASNKTSERGFLSFEGTIAPASLFLKLYFENKKLEDVESFIKNSMNYWNMYFENYFHNHKKELKNLLKKCPMIHIFTGDYTSAASTDLESKFIESGIFNVLTHEKKNFSHGRFINHEHLNTNWNIYLRKYHISAYEEALIAYLKKDDLLILESKYDGVLSEYDLLIASQYLIYHLSKFMDIDFSKPTYSDDAMKIYFYKGEL